MFLFNQYRNAQQKYACGDQVVALNWKTDLRTNPAFGAESTAVIDEHGNLFFGSHSGNFYSLDKNGEIRWVFTSMKKIYSSPLLINDQVIFTGGDGFLYALSKSNGKLIWKKYLAESLNLTLKKKLITYLLHFPFTFDIRRKRNITYKSWASPNLIQNRIVVTGFGKGLFCLDANGKLIWEYDLGFPRFQLSGVTVDGKDRIYCTSRSGKLHCINVDGNLIWERNIKSKWEPWGNPVYCHNSNRIYFSFSKGETRGFVYAITSDGKYLWKTTVGAIRGSIAISQDFSRLYCCDLDGFIYELSANTGEILFRLQITFCKRGLWITPTIDSEGNILLSTKDSNDSGRVIKLNKKFEIIWEYKTNKVLSVPIILPHGDVLFGSWDGYYYSIKTIK